MGASLEAGGESLMKKHLKECRRLITGNGILGEYGLIEEMVETLLVLKKDGVPEWKSKYCFLF